MATHQELCEKADKWLRTKCNCSTVITELKAKTRTGEIPDSIGFKSTRSKTTRSILIECKTSRADFRADAKKEFRADPKMGMGDFRFYLCPEGVIKVDDLPEKWGLLYDMGEGKPLKVIHGPKGSYWSREYAFQFKGNKETEMMLMLSALRRIQEEEPDVFKEKVYKKAPPRARRRKRTYKSSRIAA